MIKEFFIKKETIVILCIAIISVFFVVLGFLFLFFKNDYDAQPRIIPSDIESITWKTFSSKIIKQKITYPEYMYIDEQKKLADTGINISEFKPQNFLTYFSNQNHFSIYPEGSENEFFYGKTNESEFVSTTGKVYTQIEYLTNDNVVWAVLFVPQQLPSGWQSNGFIWMQAQIQNREILCMSEEGIVISDVVCDPYQGQSFMYSGTVAGSGKFLKLGYEIINKNNFE